MNKFAATASAIFLTGALSLAGTQAAQAAVTPGTLVPGSQLFVFEFDDAFTGDLLTLDPGTGVTTPKGSSALGGGWSGSAFNPTDGKIYVIGIHNWADPYTLYSVEPATGEFSEIADLPVGVSAGALAISREGEAYLIDWNEELYSFDLTDASVTSIGNTETFGDTYSFAINPVDGRAYVLSFDYDDVENNLVEVDLSDGSTTLILADYDTVTGKKSGALAFDSNGTAWLQMESGQAELWSADINDFAATARFESYFLNPTDNEDRFYTEAIAIATGLPDEHELAETGVSTEQLAFSGAVAFAAVAGGATIAIRRRRIS
ncbi:MAG: hypothetical protein RLZZ587_926 [Actinomycetota bacterium]